MGTILERRNSEILATPLGFDASSEECPSAAASVAQLSSRISFSSLASMVAGSPSRAALVSPLHLRVLNDIQPHVDIELAEDGDDLESLLRTELDRGRDAAFFLIDLGKVVRKYKQWTRLLPRVRPYYAVKCNPNEGVLRTLVALGCGFDCASKNEVETILSLGVAPEDIIFANPCKMTSHIKHVRSRNVTLMTFDNEAELLKIKSVYPSARLVLRLLPPDAGSAVCCFGSKFGADESSARSLLAMAQQLDLSVVGVSFHVGSGCFSVNAFTDAIRMARGIFDYAESELGMHLTLLDIGGGFPGTDCDVPLSFPSIATAVGPLIDALFPEHVDVIAEPGRYFATECASLAVNIIAKRGQQLHQQQQQLQQQQPPQQPSHRDVLSVPQLKDRLQRHQQDQQDHQQLRQPSTPPSTPMLLSSQGSPTASSFLADAVERNGSSDGSAALSDERSSFPLLSDLSVPLAVGHRTVGSAAADPLSLSSSSSSSPPPPPSIALSLDTAAAVRGPWASVPPSPSTSVSAMARFLPSSSASVQSEPPTPSFQMESGPAADPALRSERERRIAGVAGPPAAEQEAPVLYYISDGVYGSFNNTFFDHAHVQPHILYPERVNSKQTRTSTLFGPTCDSIDKVCDKIDLPELHVGDWIYFVNMGAYTMASASSFNGFEPPPIKYIMSRF